MKNHSKAVNSVFLSDDKKMIVSCSNDNSIIVWVLNKETKIFEILQTLNQFDNPINAVCLSKDKQTIIAGCEESTIKVWNFNKEDEEFLYSQTLRALTLPFRR